MIYSQPWLDNAELDQYAVNHPSFNHIVEGVMGGAASVRTYSVQYVYYYYTSNHFHIFHVILGLNNVYILNGVGTYEFNFRVRFPFDFLNIDQYLLL